MDKKEFAKAYEPQKYEDEIYKRWEESGFFNPDSLPGKRKDTYSIVLPPPNVTGILHIGHAMMLAVEDLLIRYKRLKGYETLWLPGVDHAAIATAAKVEKILFEESGKTRHDLGREEFLKKVNKYIDTTRSTIVSQIKKMGASCDWSRMAYTLDDERTLAVRTIFKRMYDDGLIYRGNRIVNWCPRCSSTLSDDEVEHRDIDGKLYFIKYGPFTIATTRPETKIGDTGAAVHPDDKRYQEFIGQEFDVNLGKVDIKIKVIADAEVDPEFGTGVVGVTPAHSQVDFDMAQRHDLPIKQVIGEDGKMTKAAGAYSGLTTEECREQFVADLEAAGLMEKTEDYPMSLSVCYRCATPVEPLTSKQWFVDVNKKIPKKGKSLKELASEVVAEGDIKILPDRFTKVYFNWMDNLRDWCISRQIWFGHRIPVWYRQFSQSPISNLQSPEDEEVYVGIEPPEGDGWIQDPDTLDTWFSSGLWTFSTLGWPEKTKDLKKFHPTDVLETAPDILFFWVARMIIMTTYALGEIPFRDVYLHGIIRDEQGRKMSKSLGNVINPVDVAKKFGTDAVRLSLLIGNAPGNDINLGEEKIAGFRNFANKLWNISRFILTAVDNPEPVAKAPKPQTPADAWILSRFSRVKEMVEKNIEDYQLSAAGEILRDFTWNEFADWYLEIAKVEKQKDEILLFILERLLVMWHPFMPFVTEQIWSYFAPQGLIMVADWPRDEKKLINLKKEKEFETVKELIAAIRNLRGVYNILPSLKINVFVSAGSSIDLIEENREIIKSMARIQDLHVGKKTDKPNQALTAVIGKIIAYVPTDGVIDLEKERTRLKKELANLESYANGLRKKLDNINFVTNAPKEVVEAEKGRLAEAGEKLKKIKEQIKAL